MYCIYLFEDIDLWQNSVNMEMDLQVSRSTSNSLAGCRVKQCCLFKEDFAAHNYWGINCRLHLLTSRLFDLLHV